MTLRLEAHPAFRAPVLVVACGGWVDAGDAGASAAAIVRTALGEGARFGSYDLEDLLDLQATRPVVRFDHGGARALDWPVLDLAGGRLGRDVVTCVGPEPSLRWRTVAGDLVDLARRLGVAQAVMLGGMPALVSHRRAVPVLATATDPALAADVGPRRDAYAGPTGFQTVLQRALGDAGVPAIGLWAQVPHYLAAVPSPPATRALLARAREVAGIVVDLGALDAAAAEYRQRVDDELATRPDVRELVRAIEEETDAIPGVDDLAEEIERFLRDEDD